MYFETRVKYVKVSADGREASVCEAYLLDAVSHTEAESRIVQEMGSVMRGDYSIPSIKPSNISEVVVSTDERDDRLYKAKVIIIDTDEASGKEKASGRCYLIRGADISRALENLKKALEGYVVPWEVYSITDTPFMDVFPYSGSQ